MSDEGWPPPEPVYMVVGAVIGFLVMALIGLFLSTVVWAGLQAFGVVT